MTGLLTCAYCAEAPVACCTVIAGAKPEDPAKVCTQADKRRVVVVRACEQHRDRLPALADR